eukprot:jgi/Chlat1/2631/Chrsp178S02475
MAQLVMMEGLRLGPSTSASTSVRLAEVYDEEEGTLLVVADIAEEACLQEYDTHGFLLRLTAQERMLRRECDARARQRVSAWRIYSGPSGIPEGAPTGAFKRLIRKGIPAPLRLKVWMVISGAARMSAMASPVYYADLAQRGEADAVATSDWEASKQIENDLRRTFPGHAWINSEKTLSELRRVLLAYALRNPKVGYCQSMNFVAALLLLVAGEEEGAFWLLAALVETVLAENTYARDLRGTRIEQRVLAELLQEKMPRLAQHLEQVGCDIAFVSTEWFLCLYSKNLPTETTMRVWDVLFSEGSKVLFRVALALFKLNEAALLACQHVGDVIKTLNTAARRAHDRDLLLKTAFDTVGHLSMSAIWKTRQRQQSQVLAEMDAQAAQRLIQRSVKNGRASINDPDVPDSLEILSQSPPAGAPRTRTPTHAQPPTELIEMHAVNANSTRW